MQSNVIGGGVTLVTPTMQSNVIEGGGVTLVTHTMQSNVIEGGGNISHSYNAK